MSAFDLDTFVTAPVVFKVGGREYRLSGDPDVDMVARLLQAEQKINEVARQDDIESRTMAVVEATQHGKQLLVDLIHDHDPAQDAAGLKLSTQDVLILFALVMHGSSVADAVANALQLPYDPASADEDAVATADRDRPEAAGDGEEGDVAPLASARSSSAASSPSDEAEAGLPATGLA